jgi:hypothetical protein
MKSWQLKKQALISQYETPGEHSFLKIWGPNQKLLHNSGVSSLFSLREPMTKG